MNKKSKEIVKKLCFTLVIVISIISIIGCPNTVSNKTDSGADSPDNGNIEETQQSNSPWKITVEGAGTNREVKVCLKKEDSDPEKDLELSLTEAESKLKDWIKTASDGNEIEITFVVKNHEEGDCLEISEDFRLDKDNPNKAKLKYSKKNYPKNGIKLSFKKIQGYFDALKFEKDDPIVTDWHGLGFGKKDGKFCHLVAVPKKPRDFSDLTISSESLSEAREEIKNEIGDLDGYPAGDYYSDIKDGLKKRWVATKETKNAKGSSVKWMKPTTNGVSGLNEYITNTLKISEDVLKSKEVFDFANLHAYIAVNKNRDIFVRASPYGGGIWFFADWHLVFVPKEGSPTGFENYSFHYGPYTLRNSGSEYPFVPDDKGNDSVDNHVFTLSGMLMDYLRKEKHVLAFNTTDFNPFKYKGNYDVYLIIGRAYRGDDSVFFCYEHAHCSFRNVLKLNEYGYWKDCWEKDE